MINRQRLTNNITTSLIQTIMSGVIIFILYRYLITHLGVKQLGLWSVILASTSMARFSDMGLTGSLVKFVAKYRALGQERNAAELVQTAFISIGFVMGILCLAVYPFADNLINLVIPTESIPQALIILPWAILTLWCNSLGGVFLSGLDGCQRIDIRNALMVASNLCCLIFAIFLVSKYGLLGLAVGQVIQALIIMVLSWILLRGQLKGLPLFPYSWSYSKFREMFSYAINFQINTIAVLCFDPVVKLLMSRYGGLTSAAYFEMANQCVMRLRSLIVAGTAPIVPSVAELHEVAPFRIGGLYQEAYRLLYFVSVPFFSAVFISLPVISIFWIGGLEKSFIIFGSFLCLAWGFNTLASVAYFINLGSGNLKWNSISHVSMAVLNLFLSSLLGSIYGAYGVLVGSTIAIVVASAICLITGHSKYQISIRNVIPPENYFLTSVAVLFIAILVCIDLFKYQQNLFNIAYLLIYLSTMSLVIWLHPYSKELVCKILRPR